MNFEPFTFLLERFTDFLTNQIKVFCTDEVKEIKSLQQEVEIAQILLKRVDEVQRQADINPDLQIEVRQVMEILGEIEDFLDSQIGKEAASLFSRLSGGSLKRKRSAVEGVKEMREKLHDAIQSLKGYQTHVTPRRRLETPFNTNNLVLLHLGVKTYIMFDIQDEINLPLKRMQYLGVLCLKGVDLRKTSTQIGDLVLLRHLQLDNCIVNMGHLLSIKKLRKLLSFIYSPRHLTTMMAENIVGGMEHLRHLRIWGAMKAVGAEGMENAYTGDRLTMIGS